MIAAFLTVGGAILLPSLLEPASGVGPDGAPIVGTVVPTVVLDAQRAAVASLQGDIAGAGDTGLMSSDNPQASNRFVDIMRQLVPLRGAYANHAALAKVTPDDAIAIHTAFISAVQAGIATSQPFIVSLDPNRLRGASSPESIQPAALDEILHGDPDPLTLTDLGLAVLDSVTEKVKAGQQSVLGDDQYAAIFGEDSMLRAATLAVRIDAQGLTNPSKFDPTHGLDLADNIASFPERFSGRLVDLAGNATSAVAGVVAEIASGGIAAVLTSTPVLMLVGGYFLYRAVRT